MDQGFRIYRGIPVGQMFEIPSLEVECQILQAVDIDNHSVKSLNGRRGTGSNGADIARKLPDVLGEEGQWDARNTELLPRKDEVINGEYEI
jgi:hypothetical protein